MSRPAIHAVRDVHRCRTVGCMAAVDGHARPGSPGSLRSANRRLMIETVRNLGPLTQTEVARATGLSAATVSNLARELGESGVLVAVGAAPGRRRGRLLSVAPPEGLALGIDVGHRHLRVVLADWTLTPIAERRVDSPHGQTATEALACAAQLIEQVLSEARMDRSAVAGVGLGLPAPIDRCCSTSAANPISRRSAISCSLTYADSQDSRPPSNNFASSVTSTRFSNGRMCRLPLKDSATAERSRPSRTRRRSGPRPRRQSL
jgi:DNA-binding Lrp family transcriptional regulator